MTPNDIKYQAYLQILKEELIPAMGCTEPIALAYCCAKARAVLGELPQRCAVAASGNIIKNVKSVVVPNTGGLRGIEAAAAAGLIGGDESKGLEVISHVTPDEKKQIGRYLREGRIQVRPLETGEALDMAVTVYGKEDSEATVRITGSHTNIVRIERNGRVLLSADKSAEWAEPKNGQYGENPQGPDRSLLDVRSICDFAASVNIQDIKDILDRQMIYNQAIAEEGLGGNYGANIGRTLLKAYGNPIHIRARAMAAAASDARMSGCELPVVINSGSGNQGIAASLPVMEYAKELKSSQEDLYRALALSNLIAIHQKTGIGRLSAYCGAVSAGCAAGCGIAWLKGADERAIAHTLVNSLAIVSGIICDGAKPSCAAKIAASVDAGLLGYSMYLNGQQFYGGDGIVSKGVENTIHNVGRLGKDGMRETDREIIRIMTGC